MPPRGAKNTGPPARWWRGAQPRDEVAIALRRGRELGRDGSHAQPVAVAGVDAAEQRVDEPLEHVVTELRAHQRADRDVVVRSERRRGRMHVHVGSVTMPDARSASRSVGTPSTSPSGSRRSAPSHHTYAADVAGDTSVAVDAELAAQLEAPRHTGEERVGAVVDQPAGERRRASLPPNRSAPRGRRLARPAAAGELVRGGQPGDAAAHDRDPLHGRQRLALGGQRGEHLGVVVEHAVRAKASPDVAAPSAGHDVEVVQDLEVIGDEALRADEDAVGPAGARRGRR